MAEFEVTVKFRYQVPDNPERRKEIYGTADLQECADIDAQNDAEDLLVITDDEPKISIRVVGAGE